MTDVDLANVGSLSSEEKAALLQRIDVPEVTRLINLHAQDAAEFRRRIAAARARNPHMVPWFVKLWRRLRRKGSDRPSAEEFVQIRYP